MQHLSRYDIGASDSKQTHAEEHLILKMASSRLQDTLIVTLATLTVFGRLKVNEAIALESILWILESNIVDNVRMTF